MHFNIPQKRATFYKPNPDNLHTLTLLYYEMAIPHKHKDFCSVRRICHTKKVVWDSIGRPADKIFWHALFITRRTC